MNLRIVLSLILLTTSGIIQAEEWYAMARHGECMDLSKMTERTEIIKGAHTPDEIKEILNKAGIDYILEPMSTEYDGMLKFNVPDKNWSMILVKKQFCQ